VITRFAPSPTGRLHLGHALSALMVWHAARREDGVVLLRIEDIDARRCRPEFERAICDDLNWLGLRWRGPAVRQSARLSHYAEALERLKRSGLVYPCFCTRAEIRDAATEQTPDGPIYPGTCRGLPAEEASGRMRSGARAAWRIRLDAALDAAGGIAWTDERAGRQVWDGSGWGDVVIARKDIGTSYHLAATVDDALQGITTVVRGEDLFRSTHIHVLLQKLLGLSTPRYRHHSLIEASDGEKLSKRDQAHDFRSRLSTGEGWPALLAALAENGVPPGALEDLVTVPTLNGR
jgi:glutamyl-Q tRNA(Asp) synthetase